MRRLTPADIAEADALREEVGRRRGLLDSAIATVGRAVAAGMAQDSAHWNEVCDDLAAASHAHTVATVAESNWWSSKGAPGS